MPESETSPIALISQARGRSLTEVAKQVFGAWVFAVGSSGVLGIRTITDLLLLPFNLVNDIGNSVVEDLIIKPLTIAATGSETTADAVTEFGLFGLPIGTAVLLFTMAMIAFYLSQEQTSDLLPGTFTDFLGVGVDEDGDAD